MSLLNTVAPEQAQGKVKEVYSMFEKMDMPVPLPLQMLSASPDYLAIQGQMILYFMSHNNLSPSLSSHIRLLASHEENYTHCLHLNSHILKTMMGFSDEQISAAVKDPREATLEPREKALLLFVQKIVRDPALTTQEDMDTLREQDWSDQDIFDASVIGMNMVAMGALFKAFKMGEKS